MYWAVALSILFLVKLDPCLSQSCATCELYKNYCYVVGGKVDNPTAQTFCSNAGGQLPIFISTYDLADYNAYKTLKFGSDSTWIGYWNYNSHTATTPGLWKDQNGVGTTAVFTAFAAGEPNDGPGGNSCIQNYGAAGWNDNACSVQCYAICMCKCPLVAQIVNGQTVNTALPVANSITLFTCNPGYKLIGHSSINCSYIGTTLKWSDNAPSCQRMECTDWFTRVTGSVQSAPFYAGLNYNYTCNSNYVLNAGAVVYATYNCDLVSGSWVQTVFTACAATCPKINSISHGSVSTVGETSMLPGRISVGGTSSFVCDTNYFLEGNPIITCNSDGNWSSSSPLCNPTCETIFNVTFGLVTHKGTIMTMPGRNKLDSVILFTCNSGYYMVGNNSLVCTASGNWSDTIPVCKPIPVSTNWWLWPVVVGLITFLAVSCCFLAFICKRKKTKKLEELEKNSSARVKADVPKMEVDNPPPLRF